MAGSERSGNADGSPSAALFRSVRSVTVNSAGDIFVADSGNNAIRKISSSGLFDNDFVVEICFLLLLVLCFFFSSTGDHTCGRRDCG